MGQAKQRGTYEQRKDAAIAKRLEKEERERQQREAEHQARLEAQRKREMARPERPRVRVSRGTRHRLAIMGVLAAAGVAVISRGEFDSPAS